MTSSWYSGSPFVSRMVRTAIKQGTREWHLLRHHLITASNVGALLRSPAERFKAIDRWTNIVPKLPPSATSPAMDYGVTCEPFARDAYHQHVEPLSDKDGGFWLDDTNDWLAASPDALTETDVIEFKCPFAKIVPSPTSTKFQDYAMQVFTQMAVTGRRGGKLVFWVPLTLPLEPGDTFIPRNELEVVFNRRVKHQFTIFNFVYDESFERCLDYLEQLYVERQDPGPAPHFGGWRPTLCTTIEV